MKELMRILKIKLLVSCVICVIHVCLLAGTIGLLSRVHAAEVSFPSTVVYFTVGRSYENLADAAQVYANLNCALSGSPQYCVVVEAYDNPGLAGWWVSWQYVSVFGDGIRTGGATEDYARVCPPGYGLIGGFCVSNGPKPDKQFGCDVCTGGKVSVGNPINVGNESKYQLESDYIGNGLGALRFQRHYNSRSSSSPAPIANLLFDNVLGNGWRHTYQRRVWVSSLSGGGMAAVHRQDGKIHYFAQSGGVWIADSDISDSLERLSDSAENLIGWRYKVAVDESTEVYDAVGNLTSISTREGLTQTLAYSDTNTPILIASRPGLLVSVTDNFGRQLSFAYDSKNRLASMTDPAGRVYVYTHYESAKALASVTYPDINFPNVASNVNRTYLYNEPEHVATANLIKLTGIVDENGSRYATFKFDTSNRPIVSEHAGGVDRVAIDYSGENPVVTDVLGSTQTYLFQLLLGVRRNGNIVGNACPNCGPKSQTYDVNGNISSRVDWNSNRTCYAYDLTRNLETARGEGLGPVRNFVCKAYHVN